MRTLFVTEQQKYLAYRSVIFRVASSLGVKNKERKSNHDLFSEIKNSGSPLLDPMYAYFIAYDNWFQYKKTMAQRSTTATKDLAEVPSSSLTLLEKVKAKAFRKFERECELLEA